MNDKTKRLLFTVLRIAVSLGVSSFLVYNVVVKSGVNLGEELGHVVLSLLAAAVLVYGLIIAVCVLRWQVLLTVQGVHLSYWALYRLTMVGVFFNLVVPGAVGGDVMKMVYIAKHAGSKTTEAVTTIMLDRVIGLLGLFVVAMAFCLGNLHYLLDPSHNMREVTIGIFLCSGAGIVGSLGVAFHNDLQKLPGVNALLAFFGRVLPEKITGIIVRVTAAIDLYQTKRSMVALALAISCVVHLLNGVVVLSLGRAFGERDVGAQHYFLAIQVANTVGAVPIFPAGIGGRDATIQKYMKSVGPQEPPAVVEDFEKKAGVIPIFFTVVMVFWSLVGGIFFLFSKTSPDPASLPPELAAAAASGMPPEDEDDPDAVDPAHNAGPA